MMDRSNVTAISFTVEDDLISQSSLSSTQRTAFQGLKPFGKQYGIPFDEQPLPNKKNREIMQKAKSDAYKEMGQHLFNPFEHKLNNNFVPSESTLYTQQKQRQLESLSNILNNTERNQLQMINEQKNYTIVFKDDRKIKNSLQMAGKNIVSESEVANIGDYYKKKFGKRQMQHIQEEDEVDLDENTRKNTCKNNTKKPPYQPKINKTQITRNKSNEKIDQRKISSSETAQRKVVQIPNKISKPQAPSIKPQFEQNVKKNNTEQIGSVKGSRGKEMNIKKQDGKKAMVKKPPIPKQNIKSNEKKKFSEVYEGTDRNLVQQLERQLAQCPKICFDDIAELEVAKNLLQQAVLLPRLMPQFFQGIRKAMKGILLFGPPGTGKTLLAKAVAKDNIFFNVSASSLASKWKGESQKMVRILFEMAKYYSPSVIFFDEIDCIGSKRSENQHESARKVKTQLLVQMDGVGSTDSEVFVLAATNRPWDLDEALRRRLEKRIYIPLPQNQGRKKMFQINLKDLNVSPTIDWDKLIKLTNGCSGADICNICRDAAYMPMRRKITQIGGITKLQQLNQNQLMEEQILQKDLIEASMKIKPSVGKEDLKRYEAWMSQFGSS